MIYLFKQIHSSEDVFRHIYAEMVYRGYECQRINDDKVEHQRSVINHYRGTKITLITADHMNLALRDDCYSTDEVIKIIKPVRSVFTMHDLAIHAVTDNLAMFDAVMIPHKTWAPLFNHPNVHVIGYPRFIHAHRVPKYKAVFFVSSVYVLIERSEESLIQNFSLFLDNDIPFKFPIFTNIDRLESLITRNGGKIIPSYIESFRVLLNTDIAFSNASSSICIEASIAGCHSINLGYSLENFYNEYNVRNHLSFTRQEYIEYCGLPTPPPKLDHLLDIDKAIDIITDTKKP